MKKIRYIVIGMLIMLGLYMYIYIAAYADERNFESDTELIKIEQTEAKETLLYLNWRTIGAQNFQTSDSPLKELVVADDCLIVGTENNRIGVFDLTGQYQRGFAFDTTGGYDIFYNSSYHVFTVYIWRGGYFFTFDKNGNLVAIEKSDVMHKDDIKYCSVNNDQSDMNFYLDRSNKNLIFSRGYDRIVTENQDGNTEIIYEMRLSLIDGNVIAKTIVFMVALIIVGLIVFLSFCKKEYRHTLITKTRKMID